MAEALDGLLAEIRACRRCVEAPIGAPLPHEPRPVLRATVTARIAVCSQAPGTRVHASGVPFLDASGDRLRAWMGVERNEFYDSRRVAIVPMGFCFPGLDAHGSDLPPRRECAPLWRDRVLAALPDLELVLLVGTYAQRWHLAEARRDSMTAVVRSWRTWAQRNDLPRYLPLPHPSWRNNAWVKNNPWFQRQLLPALRLMVRKLLDGPERREPDQPAKATTPPQGKQRRSPRRAPPIG
jgi:uracil-DNA glycosylase